MKFSNQSENLMEVFMKYFKKYLKKKDALQQKGFDKIMKKFYKEIKASEKNVKKLFISNKVKVNIQETENFTQIVQSSLLNSTYVPIEINTFIKNNMKGIISYTTKVGSRKINLSFYLTNNSQFNELKKIETMAFRMLTWLFFITPYANKRCSKELNVFIYLTPLKKFIPNSQFTVLSNINANSGVTTSCSAIGEICLFRVEELFKVFIHETFHILGLDFSNMSNTIINRKMKLQFPINSKFNLYEAYTEFWAVIMNCTFTAYYMCENSVTDFLIYLEFCIAFEEYFSLFQCVKILKFMGLNYRYLHGKDNLSVRARKYLYKENTNIFAYYVIKTILLFNNYYFLMWCKRNNTNIINFEKTKGNLNKFYHFIVNHYKEVNFVNAINNMEDDYNQIKGGDDESKNHTMNTMRMTIIEIV